MNRKILNDIRNMMFRRRILLLSKMFDHNLSKQHKSLDKFPTKQSTFNSSLQKKHCMYHLKVLSKKKSSGIFTSSCKRINNKNNKNA